MAGSESGEQEHGGAAAQDASAPASSRALSEARAMLSDVIGDEDVDDVVTLEIDNPLLNVAKEPS